jgi:hypothetical protein
VLPFANPTIKYETLRLASKKSKAMLTELCETMKGIEEIHPLPTHPSYFDEWVEDIEIFWESTGEAFPPEWYTLLSLRKRIFELSFNSQVTPPVTDTWKWLLTVDQMPQRTTDWYSQKRSMLTASEISQLWKGPRSRINLIASKSSPPSEPTAKRLATLRKDTNPMDWGVRYEPIVKLILEREGAQIQELGRIQHRTVQGLAASPDGLYTCGPLRGSLVEIKCPITRTIEAKIPFDYWCQMQIQMEVCDIDVCEYVEAKFVENSEDRDPEGYVSLCITKDDVDEMKYVYHHTPTFTLADDDPWICIETYSWACSSIRRTLVKRDTEWFARMQPDIALFWTEVTEVREGRRILEPVKKKKVEVAELTYSFIDE